MTDPAASHGGPRHGFDYALIREIRSVCLRPSTVRGSFGDSRDPVRNIRHGSISYPDIRRATSTTNSRALNDRRAIMHPSENSHLSTLLEPRAATIAQQVSVLLEEHPAARVPADMATRSVVGVAAHAVIAIVAPIVDRFEPRGLTEVVIGLSRALCSPSRMHRRNSTLIAGFAAEYLRGVSRPRSPWECVDSEVRIGTGVADLVWQHRDSGLVFLDEVKTTNVPRPFLDKNWLEQARRYAHDGGREWGDLFLGVRIVPLGSLNVASLVLPDGAVRPLGLNVDDPLRVRAVGGAR